MVSDDIIIEGGVVRNASVSDFPEGDRMHGSQSMKRYLLTVFSVMAVLYFGAFFLATSPLYDRVNPSFYAKPLNYAFATADENADVVIFGDSTALLGVDPMQMSSALGVKVLNLVNTQPSLVVNDDMSLRHYLKQNRRPRLIIFYFAPWDFDYGHNDFNLRPTYEGEELLLRHGTAQEMRVFAQKHPREVLMFPLKFYGTAWQFTMHHIPRGDQNAQLRATRGHVDNTERTVMKTSCQFPQYLVDNIRFSWVHDLGERYKTPETKVLFYVAPVPACENAAAVIDRPYEQLPANPPRGAAPEFFSSDVRFIHPRPAAVPALTDSLIEAVRHLLASQVNAVSSGARTQLRRRPDTSSLP